MGGFFSLFGFLGTGYGVLFTMALTLSLLAIWEWRVMLAVIVLVQLAIGTLMIRFQGTEPRWMGVQLVVMIFCCAMLALSVLDMQSTTLLRRRSNLGLHLLLIPLLICAWWLLKIDLPLEGLNPVLRQLLMWLALIALVQMSVGSDPMSVGVGLLIWCIPLQALAVRFAPIPALLAMIGVMELVIALACAYLVLTDRNPALSPPRQPLMLLRDRNRAATQSGPAPIPVTRPRSASEKV
ncbi:MAG: hypothetical protein U0175_27815 [Caldilineaceae bacterium]